MRAIGISAQAGAIQVLDADGNPIGPVVSWLDGRGRAFDQQFLQELGSEWFSAHCGRGKPGVAIGQILRLRQHEPDLLAAPHKIGFVGDRIVSRLCGRWAHDATSMSITMLYNPARRDADPELLERLGISHDQLPELLASTAVAGPLREDVAAELNLPAGIAVSPAVHDQYCAVLGCGAVRVGDVMFGAGTAWVLLATTDIFAPPVIPEAFVCTHAVEGLFGQLLSMANGGSAFSWALQLLGLAEAPGEQIERMLASVAPGADGLRFWPLLVPLGGARLATDTRGRLAGLQFCHTNAHVLRAVAEGLAYELQRYLAFLTDAGIVIERLVMCGGAAAGNVTPQIIADVTGLQVDCTSESAMSAHGAAVLARKLAEPDANLAELSRRMAPAVRNVTPDEHQDPYRKLAREYVASLPAADTQ